MKSKYILKATFFVLFTCLGCTSTHKNKLIKPTDSFTIRVTDFLIDGEGYYPTQNKGVIRYGNRSLPVQLYDTYYLQVIINEYDEGKKTVQELEYVLYETLNGLATAILKNSVTLEGKEVTLKENLDEGRKIQFDITIQFE